MTQRTKEQQIRVLKMIALRRANWTLQQIGDRFSLTRQRVQQLLEGTPRPQPPQPKWPRRYLHRTMRQWLWDAGYRKCTSCKIWLCGLTRTNRQCKQCNARHMAAYYKTERGRAAQRAWKEANVDRLRETKKRWSKANPEKVKAYRQRYAERRQSV